MKIAQITSIYISVPPKTYGGTERIVYYLCQLLARRGHDVELFASGDSKVDCALRSVVPVACQDDPRSTVYLEKEFEARHTYDLYRQADRFDLIHAHWPTLAPYFSALSPTTTVMTYGYIEKAVHDYYRRRFPRCLPVCVSKSQRVLLGDHSIPVVYNGVDTTAIRFEDKPDDFFIIVGRMTPGKGIAEAIRIAQKTGVRLLIIGHVTSHLPWSEEYFLKAVKPHIDGRRICYIERLPYAEVVQLMGKAKAFLFPLQWDEPFGMVVIEAMAAGTPVIAYPRGAMPELIRDGETGYLPATEEEMLDSLHRVEHLDRAHCRRWVEEHFSIERMVEDYERLYKVAMGGAWPQTQA